MTVLSYVKQGTFLQIKQGMSPSPFGANVDVRTAATRASSVITSVKLVLSYSTTFAPLNGIVKLFAKSDTNILDGSTLLCGVASTVSETIKVMVPVPYEMTADVAFGNIVSGISVMINASVALLSSSSRSFNAPFGNRKNVLLPSPPFVSRKPYCCSPLRFCQLDRSRPKIVPP